MIDIWQPGGYCYYNYDPFRCGDYGYYPRPGYFVPHPDYDYRDRVSCREAAGLSGSAAFAMCARADCGGKFHTFIGQEKVRNFQD